MCNADKAGGSSPRAWGIRAGHRVKGKPRTVHPHVRGEYGAELALSGIDRRFIPTCVGNTKPYSGMMAATSVHPHVRGEYTRVMRLAFLRVGSSPRAWGIRSASGQRTGCRTVHPHVRGEYVVTVAPAEQDIGSSPRAWGIRKSTPAQRVNTRFIPTCVGNTFFAERDAALCPVHPHVRGEYGYGRQCQCRSMGSSPRAWGIRHGAYIGREMTRFIPTCVGNTRR